MNLKKCLNEITFSQFGANVSAKTEGAIACIQGRDFNSDGEYISKETQYADASALKYTRYLEERDVLFSCKGKLFATVWRNQVANAIASGTFIIFKVKDPDILPEYLALYLNSKKARRYFDLYIKAATVTHIGKKELEKLEIEIPTIEKQKALIVYQNLVLKEKKLANELFLRKQKILDYLL